MVKAFILCGGKGTRLRPYTYEAPKPMLLLGKKPILQYVVENMKNSGITELIFTVGYMREKIMDYFGNGSKFGVKITYLEDNEELNTAGSVLAGKNLISETFIVAMGDHLTKIDLKKMLEFHRKNKAIGTIALQKQSTHIDFGVVKTEGERVTGFEEKPVLTHLINTGIYVFEPEIFSQIKEKDDFAKDIFPRLLNEKKKLNGFVFGEYWMDIGKKEVYEEIADLVSKNKFPHL
ncbi:Bifunctional protein GlmU [Candidatus Gugararchaeum adminiculabundum]|nr:Bifunctional protein GlmU [Candidatus Gugararchaeum adminiculabundum]